MNRHFTFGMLSLIQILPDGSARASWSLKYLSHALALEFKGRDLEALLEIWEYCLKCFAEHIPYHWLKDEDLTSCIKSILSSGKSLGDFLSPFHLAEFGFVKHLLS